MAQDLVSARAAPRGDLDDRRSLDQVDISVVIPAYLGARTIADCLDSVERATVGRRREIIVVESSNDGTADIVRARFPDVLIIRTTERLSAGGARNLGAKNSRGQLIFFTDQDCVVPTDWIERLAQHLDDAAIGAAGGAVGIRNLSNLSGCAVYFLEFLNHFPSRRPPRRDVNFLVGCNSAYRAAALRAVHFPDQTLGEDVLFSHDLRRNGFGVVYDPSIEVRHWNREGWREFFSYNRKMGRSAAHYHKILVRSWVRPFLRVPTLAFLSPAVILPSIAIGLARSRLSYLVRFLLLSPVCLLGNLAWASAFRREILDSRSRGAADREPSETA